MAVKSNREAIIAAARRGALRAVLDGANVILEEANSLVLSTEKSGRVYRRRGVEHQASAPGEPPSSDTGRLAQSARVELDAQRVAAAAIWSTAYAASLEFGNERIAPRPFIRPAMANRKEEISKLIAEAIIFEIVRAAAR